MHVASDSVLPRRSMTRLLTLGAAAVLIIVGLLALHTLGAESPAHAGIVAPASLDDSGKPAGTPASNQSLGQCGESCQAVGAEWPLDQDTVIACVLALLSGLLVLLAPRLSLYRIAAACMTAATFAASRSSGYQRAPSLIALSISRT